MLQWTSVSLPLPTSTGFVAHETRYEPGATLAPHYHAHASLSLVFSGEQRERVGQSMSVVFKTAEVDHSDYVGAMGMHGLFIELMPATLESFTTAVGSPADVACFVGSPTRSLVRRIRRELSVRQPCHEFAVEGLIHELLAEVGRAHVATLSGKWVARVRAYLDAHFRDNVRLKEIGTQVGMHPTHVAVAFRQAYNCTPGDYIRSLRIEYARRALHSRRSLSDIALEGGFADQSHFTRTFRRRFGVTPGAYRGEHRL